MSKVEDRHYFSISGEGLELLDSLAEPFGTSSRRETLTKLLCLGQSAKPFIRNGILTVVDPAIQSGESCDREVNLELIDGKSALTTALQKGAQLVRQKGRPFFNG